MRGNVAVFLLGEVPVDGEELEGVADEFDVIAHPVPEGDGLSDEDPDVAIVVGDRVGTAVDRLEVPVVGVAGDPSTALSRGADEWLPPDPPVDLVTHRLRGVIERRRQERRERELEQYETIVETLPDGMFLLDEDGVILDGNASTARLLDYGKEELVGEPFLRLVDDGVVPASAVDRYLAGVRELLSSGNDLETDRFEVEVTPREGGYRVLEIHLALRPFEESFRGTVSVVRDVTDRRQRERQLRRQNERLEEFASAVSHDLRNPLNVALVTAELLAEEVDADELDRLHRSLDRMDGLVEDLLELARTGRTITETAAVDLGDVAADAWTTVATEDAEIAVRTDAVVAADRSRLRQLLENLFRNAVEHGSTGGDVSRVEVGDLPDGRGFYVADDGPGIPPEERDEVLEHGYTTSEDGTGFGLAIVRSVAAAHGWDVELTGSESGGARFEFTGVERAG